MDPWSNIETTRRDKEIDEINNLERFINDIPIPVRKIRELITRFEVCHFKYQQHLKYIESSIYKLEPVVNIRKIGAIHISKGEKVWIKDKTGRSQVGQQYLWALTNWLDRTDENNLPKNYNRNLDIKITRWLGDKTPDKERIVRLLIARLTYDWKSYQKFQTSGQYQDFEYQACRMDICHYAFPKHLDALLKAFGKMQLPDKPEGCGSYNSKIKSFIQGIYSEISESIIMTFNHESFIDLNRNELLRLWLNLCLAKTLKEQTGITDSLPKFSRLIKLKFL